MAWSNDVGFNKGLNEEMRLTADELKSIEQQMAVKVAEYHAAKEAERLEHAAEQWDYYDANCMPGGLYAGLSPLKRQEIETSLHQSVGPRPELKSPAEIAAEAAAERDEQAQWLSVVNGRPTAYDGKIIG